MIFGRVAFEGSEKRWVGFFIIYSAYVRRPGWRREGELRRDVRRDSTDRMRVPVLGKRVEDADHTRM